MADPEPTTEGLRGALDAARADALRLAGELALAESRLRTISELTSDYCYDVEITADGRRQISWGTDAMAKVGGYSFEEMQQRSGTRWLVYPDDYPIFDAYIADLLSNRPTSAELRLIAKDGGIRTMRVRNMPVWDAAAGRVGRIIGVAHDLTAQRVAERERAAAERRLMVAQKLEGLGLLAGGIAHDFNNLLTIIGGNMELALEDLPPDSPVAPLLGAAYSSARRAAELTAQLLLYSGRGQLALRPLDIAAFLAAQCELLRASIGWAHDVQYLADAGLPPILADEHQLIQMLSSMVASAAAAMHGDAASIVVRCAALRCAAAAWATIDLSGAPGIADYLCISVHDGGAPIPPEEIGRLFDPFGGSRRQERGIGLAVVHGIINSHQGALRIESAPGTGTTISVLLPLAPQAAHAPETGGAVAAPAGGAVLVVDDQHDVRRVVVRMLGHMGYRALEAASGAEALALLAAEPALHCVLLDLMMPVMSGEEVLRQIRIAQPQLSVIVMSGYSGDEISTRLSDLPGVRALQKPFTNAELRAALAAG